MRLENKTYKLDKIDKEHIRNLYIDGMSAEKLSKIYNVNTTTIFRALKVNGKNPIRFKKKADESFDYQDIQNEILWNSNRIIELLEKVLEKLV